SVTSCTGSPTSLGRRHTQTNYSGTTNNWYHSNRLSPALWSNGSASMANALANRAVIENEPLQLEHDLEAEAVQSGQDPTYTFRFSLTLPTGAMTLNDREVSTINFEMSCFKELYNKLISSNDLNTTLLKLANAAYQSKWASKRT